MEHDTCCIMNGETFEKLEVWQRAIEVSVRLHGLLRDCRDFAFRNQITASSDSVSANIAEGAERTTKAEFRQFLSYAKGSAGETRSRLYIARCLDYVSETEAEKTLDELRRISRMLHGLIESLKRG
jgi:four helix bundle protein